MSKLAVPKGNSGNSTLPPEPPGFGGGGPDGEPNPIGVHRQASLTGLWLLLLIVTITFSAFVLVFWLRRSSYDWVGTPVPKIVWANTAVLFLSSAMLEFARRLLGSNRRAFFNWFWTCGSLLGIAFLGGQWLAWEELQAKGLYLATNPSASFFYILTIAHALHVVGGVVALAYVGLQAWRFQLGPAKRTGVLVTCVYWHFLEVLWLALLALLVLWG